MKHHLGAFFAVVIFSWAYMGCSGSRSQQPIVPSVQGPTIAASSIPVGQSQVITTDNGALVLVHNVGGKLLFPVEGTYSSEAFAEMLSSHPQSEAARKSAVEGETRKVFDKLSTKGAIAFKQYPGVGYFKFLLPYEPNMLEAVKSMEFDHALLFNPVFYDPSPLKDIQPMSPATAGKAPVSGRASTSAFSGLERIRAPEFVARAESDIGGSAKVDGSSVKIGITDTGITLNHPTFLSNSGKNRVAYLRDFTREGRVYFSPKAKFEVSEDPSDSSSLTLNAEVIVTPKLPNFPAGDSFTPINGMKIKVSPELRALLLKSDSGAKLGVLNEDAFQGPEGQVDINANGKLDDLIPMILIPGKTSADDVVYVDFSASGDFEDAKPIGTWNRTHDTVNVFAETIGLDIKDDQLPKSDGSGAVAVKSASVVGFDPGNHGSHVSGIAAGRKTIANDKDNTLARGVAPEAAIYMNRVCANNGGCNATEAFIDLATNAGVDVINMSLGGLSPFNDGYGVQETVINRLVSLKNVLFSISAGNSGPGRQTVGSPSVARFALSIGAAASKSMIERQYEWPGANSDRDDDMVLFFSSRGPTAAGGFKPNVTAPGTELSSVQLNSAPGGRGGLDVYWGTSMAAPTATGAYALFLDGIRKYNLAHPSNPLPTDVLTLREVLIESARPFDVSRFDPATGAKSKGQYTWIDEGRGMINLLGAWKKLFKVRDRALPSAVSSRGAPVDLDYQVIVKLKAPNGLAYDGSRSQQGKPLFGTGLYLDASSSETLRPVYISRKLPEKLAASAEAGALTRDLRTTADEFVLKTVIYGSDKAWLKAGTLDQLDCWSSPTSNLTVLGEGVSLSPTPEGKVTIIPFNASTLNVCLNRGAIAKLPPGDHGALISGYRIVDGKVAVLPSFTVPVYLTVPNKTLAASTGYEINSQVASLGVSRNYVSVPAGTTLVRVSLEVPPVKVGADGEPQCSGVELMALEGKNNATPFPSRLQARASNCDPMGAPVANDSARKVSFSMNNPTPGIWDLHVFGQYKYAFSKYKLRVDYVAATTSVAAIEGNLEALSGSLTWTVQGASFSVSPDSAKSAFELTGLSDSASSQVAKGAHVFVENALGTLRAYPADTKSVTITTGGSPGNDIDLIILECPGDAKSAADPGCAPVAASGGPTDEESATFTPQPDMLYAARVDGFDVKDEGTFTSTETMKFDSEQGTISISGSGSSFDATYGFGADQLASSAILKEPLFTSGKALAVGDLTLRMADGTVLGALPVKVAGK